MSEASNRRSSTLRYALPAVGLLAVAAWSLAAQFTHIGAAPSESEWEAARNVIRAEWQDGDVLRQAPFWADSARQMLFDQTFDPAREPEATNLLGFNRLWLISDAEHFEDALEELPAGFEVSRTWEPAARTRLALVAIPPYDVLAFDARRDLERATVTRGSFEAESELQTCTLFEDRAWHCGHVDRWTYVGDSLEEVEGSLRRCVYIGVPENGTAITFPAVELGARLRGDVGNTMGAVRAERGSSVSFSVRIDGEEVASLSLEKWEQALLPFDVEVPGGPGQHTVSFHVEAAEFFDRWMCLRAWSERP